MIKLIAAMFVFSVSVAAQAATTCDNICKSGMFMDSYKSKCLTAIADANLLEGACVICSKEFTDASKVECLTAIRNKTYTATELSVCDDNFTDANKNKCLASHGREWKRNNGNGNNTRGNSNACNCDAKKIKNQIDFALGQLQARNISITQVNQAINALKAAQDKFKECGYN